MHSYAPDRQRNIFDIVKQRQPDIFGMSKLTVPGQLRCEVSLQATQNSVQFNVLENQGQANLTERRLKLTDNFIITAIGFFLSRTVMAAAPPTQAEIATQKLYTWPNPTVFAQAGPPTEAGQLQGVYNGKWRITVNKDVFIDDAAMERFYRVPTSQEDGTIQADGWENMNWGMIPLTPSIGFSGIGDNIVQINFPTSLATSGPATGYNQLVMICDGFNVINANTGRI